MKNISRNFLIDIAALIIYSACGGIITFVCEIYILGITGKQWAGMRIIYSLARYMGASILRILDEKFRSLIVKNPDSRWQRMLADSLAMTAYQTPLYVICAVIMGMEYWQIIFAALIFTPENICLGWMYGVILDKLRQKYASPEPVET